MDDTSSFLPVVLAVIAFAVVVCVLVALFKSLRSYPPIVTKPRSSAPSDSSFDDFFSLLLVGILSYAAYKFVQSGGLKKVLSALGDMPIVVDGNVTTIETAATRDTDVAQLLREAVEKRLAQLGADGPEIEAKPTAVASDIAQMLRDAVSARLRERGI